MLGGDRKASVCRELTKTFEEFRRGTLAELAAHYAGVDNVKGEIVLRDRSATEEVTTTGGRCRSHARGPLATMPTAKAAAEAARLTGLSAARSLSASP